MPAETEQNETNGVKNAFTELLAPKKPKEKPLKHHSSWTEATRRDGLEEYTKDPASFSPERVLYYTPKWVVIRDLYPKSMVHLLLLSRDPVKNRLHPFDAFEDQEFLAEAKIEVAKMRVLAASELRRQLGKFSKEDKAREDAMRQDPPPDNLPDGRNWEAELLSGVHAKPSMNHVHVHVLSVDRISHHVNRKSHYNSFNTPFLVKLEEMPLTPRGRRWDSEWVAYLTQDMQCWRCGKMFGSRFADLKKHLEVEFENWKSI
ncbi:MAG: hypothetical protein M1825_003271 [Sarcosagium campestre]|nr:MAG: hypothetical protein M1825_003271 [Sarcosagium campestre]